MLYKISLSSSTISSPQPLDYQTGQVTSFGITGSSSGTFSATAEGTLQDITLNASSALVWFAQSSAITATSSGCLFLGPLAGARLNVSAASSATISLFLAQGIGNA
jgi:hypothetical protein